MTLLCIDDDPGDLELFREAVYTINPAYSCLLALSGKAGLQVLETTRPDIVFLDIHMPVIGGWELIKHIRADRELDKVPVYMLSTAGNRELATLYKKTGAADCLVKPLSFHELCISIRKILGEHK